MLNRRILRIKAFKVIYSYAVAGNMDLAGAYAALDAHCEATRDLYLFMLGLAGPLAREKRHRIEAARGKFHPTEEDLHPNEKFADNRLSALLDADPDLAKALSRRGLSWEPYDLFIKKVLDTLESRDYFRAYLEAEGTSLEEDVRLMTRIYENEFVDSEELAAILEETSMLWVDDLAYALTWCCHTFADLAEGQSWRLPELYQSDIIRRRKPGAEVDSDKDFVRKLVRCALTGYESYFGRITAAGPDWDSDRLFYPDIALIVLGLAEAEHFPEIPLRVTLNEYIEISKFYGSPKSRGFVNGLLDRLVAALREEGRITKTDISKKSE